MGRLELLEEPRPAAGRRRGRALPGDVVGAPARESPCCHPTTQRRRNDDPGVVVDDEHQADRTRRGAGRWPAAVLGRAQRRGGLPGRNALQRDAGLDHRPRGQALSQGAGHGGEAGLPRSCADGEPLRPRRRCLPDAGQRPCRAPGRAGDDREAGGRAPRHHARRGQGLRRRRLRQRAALHERAPARRPKYSARNTTRRFGRSAIDARTTRHPGYAASQRICGSSAINSVSRIDARSCAASRLPGRRVGSSTPSRPSPGQRPCSPTCHATRIVSPSRTGG